MKREQQLEQTLTELIEQTDKALSEGSIYTAEFQNKLENARKVLAENHKTNDTYSKMSSGFHIIGQ